MPVSLYVRPSAVCTSSAPFTHPLRTSYTPRTLLVCMDMPISLSCQDVCRSLDKRRALSSAPSVAFCVRSVCVQAAGSSPLEEEVMSLCIRCLLPQCTLFGPIIVMDCHTPYSSGQWRKFCRSSLFFALSFFRFLFLFCLGVSLCV